MNGRYRLCGLLAVNQPGYLVQRSSETAVITAGPCSCEDLEADEMMDLQSDDLLAPVVAALADRVSAVEEVLAALTDHT